MRVRQQRRERTNEPAIFMLFFPISYLSQQFLPGKTPSSGASTSVPTVANGRTDMRERAAQPSLAIFISFSGRKVQRKCLCCCWPCTLDTERMILQPNTIHTGILAKQATSHVSRESNIDETSISHVLRDKVHQYTHIPIPVRVPRMPNLIPMSEGDFSPK